VAAAQTHTISFENPTPGGGRILTDPAGIGCEVGGFFCAGTYEAGSSVTVTAQPARGFAFSGFFNGDCLGPTCALTMDADKVVRVNFVRFAPTPHQVLRRDRARGTATLTVRVGGPGTLVATGPGIVRRTISTATDANLKVHVKAKGAAARRLEEKGRSRVRVKLFFTPVEGTTALFVQRALLRLSR
jgi:hypothetical protein